MMDQTARQDPQDPLARLGLPVGAAPPVLPDRQGLRALPEVWARQAPRGQLAYPGLEERQVLQALMGQGVQLAPQDPRELRAAWAPRVRPDQLDLPEQMVLAETLVLLDRRARQVLLDLAGRPDPLAPEEAWALLGLLGRLARAEPLDPRVPRVLLALSPA